MLNVEVKLKKLPSFDSEWELPSYASPSAAGMDIRANLGTDSVMTIAPFERVLVPTGFSLEIPEGFEVQIRPRSGLSLKTGLMVVNAPGTIDADYRGEIKIILGNISMTEVKINHGDRIAQMVLAPVAKAELIESVTISETLRSEGGFGSTGIN
ncbi:MAG: dUTP diphosphatase [Bacteriovoracaceae bacterium]